VVSDFTPTLPIHGVPGSAGRALAIELISGGTRKISPIWVRAFGLSGVGVRRAR
jgi:hypothetical protein